VIDAEDSQVREVDHRTISVPSTVPVRLIYELQFVDDDLRLPDLGQLEERT